MPKVSIIVPVYNVEKYLRECLDSILSQTLSDIEIICVNDGSEDSSRIILDEYAKKDKRIKIIDKENRGLSSARNIGLKAAKGEFISFIDSDDWVSPYFIEKLYNNMVLLNTDITICAVCLYDEMIKNFEAPKPYFSLDVFDKTFDDKVFSYEDVKPFLMDVCVMAWNKLYRKSFLDRVNAEFPEGLIFEDGPFFFSIFFKTKRVSLIRDFLYNYRINRNGSIVQKGGRQFMDIIDVVELMYNSIKDLPVFNEIKNEFYIRKADDIVYRYELIDFWQKRKFSKKLREKKFLFDLEIFDFDYIKNKAPYTYNNIFGIKDKSNIIKYKFNKFQRKFMLKIMQILYTEDGIYYLKYRKLVLRLKKRAWLCDIWYEKDRIYFIIFSFIKFSFKFGYSKLEKSFK